MIHFFKQPISHLALPDKFTYPFHYTPHPLCVLAAEEVKEYIASREEWQEELAFGKMFGVLIVQKENKQETAKKKQSMKLVISLLSPAIWQGRICILILSLLFTTYCNRKDSSKLKKNKYLPSISVFVN